MKKHFYIEIYVIYGVDYSVIFNISKKDEYGALCIALINDMKESQIEKITILTRKGIRILLFNDIIKCFRPLEEAENGTSDCICGKKNITNIYKISNIEKDNILDVGSTCCKNWFEIRRENCCEYCGRKNNINRPQNCTNCTGAKIVRKGILKLSEKCKFLKEYINFGKYKGIVTYLELRDDFYNNYVNWVMSDECKTSSNNKMKIQLTYRNVNNNLLN